MPLVDENEYAMISCGPASGGISFDAYRDGRERYVWNDRTYKDAETDPRNDQERGNVQYDLALEIDSVYPKSK